MSEHREGLPKIVQSRLRQQASAPTDVHPDANVLSAFVEGSLKGSERQNLLAHLSSCAECREVVSFGLPEEGSTSVGVPGAANSWNWNSGMMRWGAVAASVVVVASAVLLLNPSNTVPKSTVSSKVLSQRVAKSEAPKVEARQSQPSAPAAATVVAESGAQKTIEKEASDEQDKTKALAEVTSKKREKSAFMRSPVVPPPAPLLQERASNNSLYKDNNKNQTMAANSNNFAGNLAHGPSNSTANASTPNIAAPGSAGNAAGGAFVGGGLPATGSSTRDKAATEPQNGRTANLSELDLKARNEQQTRTAPGQTATGVQMARKAPAPAPTKPAVTNETARTSADQVAPAMQTVEVTSAAPEFSPSTDAARTSTMMTAGTNHLWRITPEGKLLTSSGRKDGWHEVNLGDDPKVVRSLFARGSEIWFAGANGRLYHSSDGGKNWSSIKGAWSAETQIMNLVFRDAQHGELFTSENERWITSDAGKTWQKP